MKSEQEETVETGSMPLSMRRKLVLSVAVYASAALVLGVLSGPAFISGFSNRSEDEGTMDSGPFLRIKTLGNLRSAYGLVATYSPVADLVAATDSFGVRIWNASNGEVVTNISTELVAWDHVWSPTGSRIAVYCAEASARMLSVYDILSGDEVLRLKDVKLPEDRDFLAWSPDGTRICVMGDDGPTIYDLESGSVCLSLDPEVEARSLKWSPSGSDIAVCFGEGLNMYDPVDGSLVNQFLLPESEDPDCPNVLYAYDFSPNGNEIALASNTRPVVEIIDAYSGDLQSSFEYAPLAGMVAGLGEIRWSLGNRIAVLPLCILPQETVGIYDCQTDSMAYISETYYEGRGFMATPDFAWSPDGSKLAVFGDLSGYVSIWSSSGELISRWRAAEGSVHASWAPSGELLCLGAPGGTMVISDLEGREVVGFPGYMGPIRSIAWSRDVEAIASAGRLLRIWSTRNGSELAVLNCENETATIAAWHPGELVAAYIRPPDYASTLVSSTTADQRITLYDPSTGTVMARLDRDARYGVVTDIAYAPNGSLIASCWNSGEVAVRSVKEGEKLWGNPSSEKQATDLAWSPDGLWLAVISYRFHNCELVGGLLEIYNARNGSRKQRISLTARPSDLAWSDDGSMIAIAKTCLPVSKGKGVPESILDIIDPESGSLLTNVTGPEAYSVLWTANSSVITGHDDGIRFWDPATGQLIGFHAEVGGSILEWSPDRTILAASARDTIEFWSYQQILDAMSWNDAE